LENASAPLFLFQGKWFDLAIKKKQNKTLP
jgi:hypothetical protein